MILFQRQKFKMGSNISKCTKLPLVSIQKSSNCSCCRDHVTQMSKCESFKSSFRFEFDEVGTIFGRAQNNRFGMTPDPDVGLKFVFVRYENPIWISIFHRPKENHFCWKFNYCFESIWTHFKFLIHNIGKFASVIIFCRNFKFISGNILACCIVWYWSDQILRAEQWCQTQ